MLPSSKQNSWVNSRTSRFAVTEMFYQPYHRPPALSNPPLHTVLPGGRLPLKPLARHDRTRRVEDVLRLQHVLVHRREQQRAARVVEVRDDLVLHARHALPLRVADEWRVSGGLSHPPLTP